MAPAVTHAHMARGGKGGGMLSRPVRPPVARDITAKLIEPMHPAVSTCSRWPRSSAAPAVLSACLFERNEELVRLAIKRNNRSNSWNIL